MLSIGLILALWMSADGVVFDSVLQPFDLSTDRGAYPLSAVHQLESDGRHIYVRSFRETSVLQVRRDGRLLNQLGRAGQGPGEWDGGGVLMIAVDGDRVWGIGSAGTRMTAFQRGSLLVDFRVSEMTAGHFGATSNVFAATKDQLVVPSPLRATHLAEVYSADGEHLGPLGEALVTDPSMLKHNPFLNDTLWAFHKGRWYGVFKFFPTMVVFDRNFQKIRHVNLEDPWLAQTMGLLSEDGMHHTMRPLFSDMKLHGDHLYLMCQGRLLQIDADTGQFRTRTRFFGRGEGFAGPTDKPLTLPFFCFLADGTLILAHPMLLWEHDLWRAETPFLEVPGEAAGRP